MRNVGTTKISIIFNNIGTVNTCEHREMFAGTDIATDASGVFLMGLGMTILLELHK